MCVGTKVSRAAKEEVDRCRRLRMTLTCYLTWWCQNSLANSISSQILLCVAGVWYTTRECKTHVSLKRTLIVDCQCPTSTTFIHSHVQLKTMNSLGPSKNHALSSRDKLVLDLILRSYLPFQAPILPSFLSLHYRWWQKAGTDLRTRQLAKTHLLALRSLWSVCMLYFAHVAIYASPCCLQYSTI